MRKNFDLDDELIKKAEEIIENRKPKYRSLSHFVEVAIFKLVQEEKKAVQNNERK